MPSIKTSLFAIFAVMFAGAASAQTVGIATGPQGTPTNATGSAIAKVVHDATGLQTRAIPNTSNDVAMPLVQRGEVELAIASADLAFTSVMGVEQFEGRKLDKIRVVAKLFPLNVGIVVRADSDIKTAADMKGKRYPSEFKAQRGVLKVAEALLANAGLSYDDVVGVPVPNTSRGTDDFVQGRSDSAMLALGAARMKQTDAQVGGVRILPIDTSPEGLARMQKVMAVSYPYTLKAGTMPGAAVDTPVMAYDLLLVASVDTPDEIVYQTAKAMHKGRDGMIAVSPAFRDFSAEGMFVNYKGLEYHPGALKYYKEAGVAATN